LPPRSGHGYTSPPGAGRNRRLRTLHLALAGALFAAPQDPSAREVADFVNILVAADGEAAARKLESESLRKILTADGRQMDWVCREASRKAPHLALRTPASAPRVTAGLLTLTADLLAQSPGDAGCLRARQFALLADARVRRTLKMAVTSAPFVQAGEAIESLYRPASADGPAAGDPIHLLWAAQAFSEGAAVAGDAATALWDRALDLTIRLREMETEDPEIRGGIPRILLDRVRWGGARREKGVEDRLIALVEHLTTARAKAPGDMALATVFNETVSVAGSLGLRRRGLEYDAARLFPSPGLEMRVPVGNRWRSADPGESSVSQVDPERGRIRCIEVIGYDWDQNYDLPDGSRVKGDSLRDLAARFFDIERERLKKVQVRRTPAQSRLGRCPMGLAFEFEGTDDRDSFLGRREWFFKSGEGRRCTYRLALSWFWKDEPPDPEFEFVMDSVQERRG